MKLSKFVKRAKSESYCIEDVIEFDPDALTTALS